MEFLRDYWEIILGIVGSIFYIARNEARIKQLEKDVARLEKRQIDIEKAIWDKLEIIDSRITELLTAVAEMRGEMKGK